MQTKMESSRHSSNDSASSHNSGSFTSGVYHSGGSHNDSNRGLNQNSYGAQFNSSSNVKGQSYNSENNSNTNESPYSGWQNLNSSGNSSSNSSNWKEGKSVMGRGLPDNSANNDEKDRENSFSSLLGATGGSDDSSSSFLASNSSRSMPVPRMGLLGGGDSSMVTQQPAWNNSQGNSSGAWGGVSRPSNASNVPGMANSESMLVDGDMNFNGILGATGGSEAKNPSNSFRPDHSIPPPRIGLLGGGEGSTASGGWANNSGNNASGWSSGMRTSSSGPDSGASTAKPQGSWAQAAGKGLSSSSSNAGQNPVQSITSDSPKAAETSAKDNPDPEGKDLRMKAAFTEGWGMNSVNQDSPWDVPVSPTPEIGKDNQPSAVWRAPVNTGTEIWENNLRMSKGPGISVPPPTTAAPPWGHTPASNIGGHWGDDDSSSVWSGGPSSTAPPNWMDPNNSWSNSTPSEKHWGGSQSSWGDGACGSESGSSVWPGPNRGRPISNWSPIATPKKEVAPSGWEPPSPPPSRRPPPSGQFDDGTAVWGNPQRQGKVSSWKEMPSAKPIMNSNNGIVGPNGMLGGMTNIPPTGPGMIRLPNAGKSDVNQTWSKPPPTTGRSSTWQDMPGHRDSPIAGSWADDNHLHAQVKSIQGGGSHYMVGNWNDQQPGGSGPNWGAKPKSNCNWADGQVDTSSWLGPAKQGGKPLCKDIIHASKQFRILTEYGFRKEDVENALRNNNMNLDEAAAELHTMSNGMVEVDGFPGRKVRPATLYEDIPASENSMDSNFLNFKHQAKSSSGIINAAMGGQQSNAGSVSNISPALIQKLLQQQQQQQQSFPVFNANNLNNVQAFGNMKFPSNAHLRHLVQQIQMAVQAGHLNAQILNQPLAPQTLQLLYQLLQQIKVLTQLQQQQLLQSTQLTKQGMPGSNMQLNVQVAQTKQRINNLQNQICANQAIYLKQVPTQQNSLQPNHHATQMSSDIFKSNVDNMPLLQNELRDLSLKDSLHQNQSRLTQWKLAGNEKDENPPAEVTAAAPDFSRAPGPLTSKAIPTTPSSGSSLHPLLDSSDNTWSGLSGRAHGDSSWPETTASSTESTNGSNALTTSGVVRSSDSNASYTLTDLVPEFEPGKPWKGNQLKSVEDDPHITPGSIARSPLSVNNIKESNLFWPGKGTEVPASLSSSTWGYNPAGAGLNGSNVAKTGNTKAGWSSDFGGTTEYWASSKSHNASANQSWDRPQNSTFLILRNLTPQIDGSTLKTLCMQHGPLQMFHLFQNGGVALVRYSSREEASKAQSALNNCVLGNTTMLADIPSDSEIQQYLQVSSGQASWSSAQSGGGSSSGGSPFCGGGPGWNGNSSQLWSFSGSNLWGGSQPGGDHDSSTNPMNSYLPGDLLGGEPM